MAELAKCPTCNGDISSIAPKCPHCGETDFLELEIVVEECIYCGGTGYREEEKVSFWSTKPTKRKVTCSKCLGLKEIRGRRDKMTGEIIQ